MRKISKLSLLIEKKSTGGKTVYKPSYKTWNCTACGNSFFFSVTKCPLCDSDVKEVAHRVNYDAIRAEETVHYSEPKE